MRESNELKLSTSGEIPMDDFSWERTNGKAAALLRKQIEQAQNHYFKDERKSDLRVNWESGTATVSISLLGLVDPKTLLQFFDLDPREPILIAIAYDSQRFGNEEMKAPRVTLQQRGSAPLAMQKNSIRECARRFLEENFEKEIVEVVVNRTIFVLELFVDLSFLFFFFVEQANESSYTFAPKPDKTPLSAPAPVKVTPEKVNQMCQIANCNLVMSQYYLEKHNDDLNFAVDAMMRHSHQVNFQEVAKIVDLGYTPLQAEFILSSIGTPENIDNFEITVLGQQVLPIAPVEIHQEPEPNKSYNFFGFFSKSKATPNQGEPRKDPTLFFGQRAPKQDAPIVIKKVPLFVLLTFPSSFS